MLPQEAVRAHHLSRAAAWRLALRPALGQRPALRTMAAVGALLGAVALSLLLDGLLFGGSIWSC